MNALVLASALVLAASSAFAQPVVDRVVRAPSPAIAPVAVDAPLLLPDLPAVPPELAARVTALRAVVDETRECFTFQGDREEHIADRRCPGWFAALHRGGVASAHAIAAALEQGFRGNEVGHENVGHGAWLVRPRLLRLLTAAGGPAATAYLARYVGRALEVDHGLEIDTFRAALATLTTLAGEDLTRVGPWEGGAVYGDRVRMRAAVQRWLQWHRDVAPLPPAEQATLALQHNVAALAAADPAERWGAIQRLVAVPAQRAAAIASLRELVANPSLSAEGRSLVLRWARRQRVPVTMPRPTLAAR